MTALLAEEQTKARKSSKDLATWRASLFPEDYEHDNFCDDFTDLQEFLQTDKTAFTHKGRPLVFDANTDEVFVVDQCWLYRVNNAPMEIFHSESIGRQTSDALGFLLPCSSKAKDAPKWVLARNGDYTDQEYLVELPDELQGPTFSLRCLGLCTGRSKTALHRILISFSQT